MEVQIVDHSTMDPQFLFISPLPDLIIKMLGGHFAKVYINKGKDKFIGILRSKMSEL